MRTVLAFLIAPAVSDVVLSLVMAFAEAGVGPTWLEKFGSGVVYSVFACYAASYVFGTPFVFLLRRKKWETPRNYAAAGTIAGFAFFCVMSFFAIWPDSVAEIIVNLLKGALSFAALGTLVALSFAWISGVKKPVGETDSAGA